MESEERINVPAKTPEQRNLAEAQCNLAAAQCYLAEVPAASLILTSARVSQQWESREALLLPTIHYSSSSQSSSKSSISS